ncbi:MAG: endonuclease III [Lachnospiraceae bacterium]|nr:endonuclease III [Lachnospiraceae bacterium]
MTQKERIEKIIEALDKEYGTEYVCYLEHMNALELLIATILSAQCTDARVNTVTPTLFAKYKNAKDFANADLAELEEIIHPLGFYHAKAVNIIGCCKKLDEEFGGEVPSSLEDLTSLPGVGRKTANVIRGNIYHEPSIVVDTHVGRISRKLGITKKEDPKDVEFDLMKKIPKDHWILWNIHLITLGRSICKAPNPKCSECFLRDFCPTGQKAKA